MLLLSLARRLLLTPLPTVVTSHGVGLKIKDLTSYSSFGDRTEDFNGIGESGTEDPCKGNVSAPIKQAGTAAATPSKATVETDSVWLCWIT
jgi:hypothetical protein